jgi:hypothetical protein
MNIKNNDQLHRFSISLHDFEEAKRFLSEALQHKVSSIPYEALLIAAIIYFARPFSHNSKDKRLKDISKIEIDSFIDISPAERSLYDELMNLRNRCLAHAEFQYYPISINEKTGVMRGRRFSILDSHIDIKAFSDLLEKLIYQTHNKRADYIFLLKKT